jgi:hypothetical protein
MDWSPELCRSPRGIAVCAAIRAWGREGTAAFVERSGRYPRELVSELGRPRRNGGLTPPALNQGPVRLRLGGGGQQILMRAPAPTMSFNRSMREARPSGGSNLELRTRDADTTDIATESARPMTVCRRIIRLLGLTRDRLRHGQRSGRTPVCLSGSTPGRFAPTNRRAIVSATYWQNDGKIQTR